MFPNVCLVHSDILHSVTRIASVRLIKEFIGPLSAKGGVDIVTQYEPDAQLMKSICNDIVDVDPKHMLDIEPIFVKYVKPLHLRNISNTLKHHTALGKIAGECGVGGDDKFSLVLEDDAMFSNDVASVLKNIVDTAPPDADVIFLSLPSPPVLPTPSISARFHEALVLFDNCIPACDAYLVSQSAAKKLSEAMFPIRLPTNLQLSLLIKKFGLRSYVSCPNAFIDGSKLGVYTSSIETNNRLSWNQSYCRMIEILISQTMSQDQKCTEFSKAMSNQPFNEHPDIISTSAMFLTHIGKYEEANKEYERAMSIYERDKALFNDSSDFLRRYMSLFQHLQHSS
jgi:hypothetical protein